MATQRGYVYILSNRMNNVIYAGVTRNLLKRMYEHKEKLVDGFTKKYNIDKLVYYDIADSIEVAIDREKQIKGWTRKKKDELIKAFNPSWRDLYSDLVKSGHSE